MRMSFVHRCVPVCSAAQRCSRPTDTLGTQVARLESLVEQLTAQKDPVKHSVLYLGHDPSSLSYSPPLAESPQFVLFPSDSKGQAGRAVSPTVAPYAMDLRANDLCEALSQLAIREFVVVEGSGNEAWAPGGGRGETFLNEARVFVDTLPQRFQLSTRLPGFNGLGEPGWGSTASV